MGKHPLLNKLIFLILIVFIVLLFPFNVAKEVLLVKETSLNSNDVIVLTKEDLINSLKPLQQKFPSYKFFFVPIESIGSLNPLDIRSFLFSRYSTGYLLIAGSENTIPLGTLTITNSKAFSPQTIKSDIFYALENIDFDSDSLFGELYDDMLGRPLKFRFIVGRIPFDTKEEIEVYLKNIDSFENLSKDSKVMLASSFISFPNEIYLNAKILTGDGARLMELLKKDFFHNAFTMYEKSGDFPTIYDCNLPLSKENFIHEIKDKTLIIWDAHGSATSSYSEYWVDKNKDGVPAASEEIFSPFISATDSFKTNAVVLSLSCLNLNGSNNLGKAFLKNGAVAFIGSREVSYSPSYFANKDDGGSSSIAYYFAKNITEGNTIGQSLYNSFSYYFENDLYNDIEDPIEGSFLNIYDFNIYGVPFLKINLNKEALNNPQSENKSCDIDYKVEEVNGKFVLTINNIKDSFIILPKEIYIVDISSNPPKPIHDWYFNIIRVNGLHNITLTGYLRGKSTCEIEVKSDTILSKIKISAASFNKSDFNFDKVVDEKDLEILKETFGKTYMDKGFNPICDLNNDLKVDGTDFLLFQKE